MHNTQFKTVAVCHVQMLCLALALEHEQHSSATCKGSISSPPNCLDHSLLFRKAMKVLHSICQQISKTQQWPQDWKRSVFIPIPKKGNAKEHSNYHTIALISHTSKVMLKILQTRLQQCMNHEIPDVQAGFRKGRGIRDKLPTSTGSWKKQENSRKTSISA